MKKLLIIVIIILLGAAGFYWYINSGKVLDEAAPIVTSPTEEPIQITEDSPIKDKLMVTEMMKSIIPDEPEEEAELPIEIVEKVDTMVKEAQIKRTELSTEEMQAMEKEATEHLNPPSSPEPSTLDAESQTDPEEEVEMPVEEVEIPMEDAEIPALSEVEMTEHGITRQGQFIEIDAIHKGTGRAIVFPNTADGPILRLENLNVTRGPDLYVYLSRNANITSADQLGTYHSLGRLKSSKGSQNYSLPSNHDGFKSVVIWCEAFGVLFSSATLTP